MSKRKKPLSPKGQEKLIKQIKNWLRENAPQVKFFEADTVFTTNIRTFERKDLGKKGYKEKERTFESLKELQNFYESKTLKRSKKSTRKPRKNTKKRGGNAESKVADTKSKKRFSLRNALRTRKSKR